MKLTRPEIEARLDALLDRAGSLLPGPVLVDMRDLVRHGEPGLALESFCTQLQLHDARLPLAMLAEIAVLGEAMGIGKLYRGAVAGEEPSGE